MLLNRKKKTVFMIACSDTKIDPGALISRSDVEDIHIGYIAVTQECCLFKTANTGCSAIEAQPVVVTRVLSGAQSLTPCFCM